MRWYRKQISSFPFRKQINFLSIFFNPLEQSLVSIKTEKRRGSWRKKEWNVPTVWREFLSKKKNFYAIYSLTKRDDWSLKNFLCVNKKKHQFAFIINMPLFRLFVALAVFKSEYCPSILKLITKFCHTAHFWFNQQNFLIFKIFFITLMKITAKNFAVGSFQTEIKKNPMCELTEKEKVAKKWKKKRENRRAC